MTSSNYKMNMKRWNFLQFLGPLPMINQLGVHFDTQLHVHKTEHPPLSFQKTTTKQIFSNTHFFSYLFIKSLENSNSRTVGSELPNTGLSSYGSALNIMA